ncbi:multisubunit sodium/proton antiporter MrpF subunit [Tamaricihabitans halophyticus]|uniref:Multisubunit sodium/proton antiporter MrpF subunit n=1 Tax=Tamaricihabitans halophyticus TaxID=1262583 RepID=A0A4V2SUN9_9PSEU|nr:monovalent cation/H+ antiporter complex subunit F [Tamaricihabitans halophyticus]TCP55346.1 multisubunit sodium/proton antiporter MrpF subunit [Tamaricihabitans halophyticus]
MTIVFNITLGLLCVAGLLVLIRLIKGPSTLDRLLAVDVIVVLLAAGVAVGMAVLSDSSNLALLVSIVLLGFAGSITGVRLAERGERHR